MSITKKVEKRDNFLSQDDKSNYQPYVIKFRNVDQPYGGTTGALLQRMKNHRMYRMEDVSFQRRRPNETIHECDMRYSDMWKADPNMSNQLGGFAGHALQLDVTSQSGKTIRYASLRELARKTEFNRGTITKLLKGNMKNGRFRPFEFRGTKFTPVRDV